MRILLTGHKGFIGSEIYEVLTKENAIEVHGLDCKFRFDKFKSKFESFEDASDFDYVIHCGAVSNSQQVDESLWHLNYDASCRIAEYCASTDTKLIFISSATAIEPETAYGRSKRLAERFIRYRMSGTDQCILRPYNVWGFDESRKANPSIVYKLLRGKLDQVYKDCFRDFIYISDVVSAVQRVVHDWIPGTFDVGTTVPTEISALADIICAKRPPKPPVVECPIDPMLVAKENHLLPDFEASPISEFDLCINT